MMSWHQHPGDFWAGHTSRGKRYYEFSCRIRLIEL